MLVKYFVPYNRAKKLEKLGFDWDCFSWYVSEQYGLEIGLVKYADLINEAILAPTFNQAFNWFMENYWFDYSIKPVYGSKNKNKFRCNVYINGKLSQVMKQYFPDNPYFDTREEAELALLDKLIEIVENEQL